MRPSESLRIHREEVLTAVARRRTANPRVFGSVARGEDTEQSDIDILVDPLPACGIFDLNGLRQELEEVLGVAVSLVSARSLRGRMRDAVLSEARPF